MLHSGTHVLDMKWVQLKLVNNLELIQLVVAFQVIGWDKDTYGTLREMQEVKINENQRKLL